MRISLCMIVKDEAQILPRCLSAAAGLYDELIIVDTGSVDASIEVAESHGARVLHYDWQSPGNKGAARNMSIKAATGDWIVVLDADEILTQPLELRHLLEHANDLDGVLLRFQNYAPDGSVSLAWYQLRAFRNGSHFYKFREHEVPVAVGHPTYAPVDVLVEHRPPPERIQPKVGPMLERLQLDVTENPGDPHPLYFLHRQYIHAGLYRDAIATGEHYLELTAGKSFIRAECYVNLSIAYMAIEKTVKAGHCLHMAVAEDPKRREWWIRLAQHYMGRKEWQIALAHLRAVEVLEPERSYQWEPATEAMTEAMISQCQHELAHLHGHEHMH